MLQHVAFCTLDGGVLFSYCNESFDAEIKEVCSAVLRVHRGLTAVRPLLVVNGVLVSTSGLKNASVTEIQK